MQMISNRLICDTAIENNINNSSEIKVTPQSDTVFFVRLYHCGWIWKIPVRHRIGTFIVFNGKLTSPEEAAMIFTIIGKI